ncbi:MAG: DUF2889 domain-containing protein [Deltaproteobacteria bacterium]|nr:DUF2889 domain-containing protein [Deltaproteobacteria bacterium]
MSVHSDLHTRTLSVETRAAGDDCLAVRAELRDVRHVDLPVYLGVAHPAGVVHHMTLDLEVDRELTIRAVDARMGSIPFEPSAKTRGEGCRNVLPSYQRLVGTPLDADYPLRVLETVGGRLGCFHILALAQCLPLAVRAASARLCAAAVRLPRGARAGVEDSCAPWRADSPRWAEAREGAGGGFGDFRRRLCVRAFADARRALGMTAELADETAGGVHRGASLTLGLALPEFTILCAEGRLLGEPFSECGVTLAGVAALEGLSIVKGFTAAALARVGGSAGCAHLSALVIALAPVVPQAAGALAGLLRLAPEQMRRERAGNPQLDSCHMWRADGPLVDLEDPRRASPRAGETV